MHPCTDVVVNDIWPVLSAVFATFIADTRIIERSVRTVRFVVRSLGLQSAPLVEPVVTQMVGLYQSHPHSCFLYLGSILVDEYGNLDVCITGNVTAEACRLLAVPFHTPLTQNPILAIPPH